MTAADLGRYFLDPLQADVNQGNWSSTCLGGNSSACPGSQTLNGIDYTPSYTVTNVTADIDPPPARRVEVTITWNEPTPD